MVEDAVKHAKPIRPHNTWALLLVLASSVFASVALWAPRAVLPNRLPVLRLDPRAVGDALAHDRSLARNPPQGRAVDELRALYAEVGRGAHDGPHSVSHIRSRYRRLERVRRTVTQQHGLEGLWSLRAQAAERLWDALYGRLPERRAHELLGAFEKQLARYRVRDEEGRFRAPPMVTRAMFKARYNTILGLGATEGFAPVEVQAYEGWLALHGSGAPNALRHQAALRFAAAGGSQGEEAVSVWAARLGRYEQAQHALQQAIDQRRSVRLRNYLIAIRERLGPAR